MSSPVQAPPSRSEDKRANLFSLLLGAFLGLTLLKFGNPPIMEKFTASPENAWEFFLGYPWPIGWGYLLLSLLTVMGFFVARWELHIPRWLAVLPLAWLLFQLIATFRTVAPELSYPTMRHLIACAVCFYLGLFVLSRVRHLGWFWVGVLGGFVLVLVVGWQQQFGGLAQTREYFRLYIYPTMKEIPPEYLKKMSSNRIFATLFYPNALAGALLLLLPAALAVAAGARRQFTQGARALLIGLLTVAALGCLFWSGSKGGWLLMLALGLVALMRLPFPKQFKIAIACGVLLVGLGGFFWKYSAFFQRGATSVSARFDYWEAAVKTALAHPFTGTGPGTFARPYQALKRPESEMSRLVHNDYLEQASDSGLGGFATYTVFIVAGLVYASRRFRFTLERCGGPIDSLATPARPRMNAAVRPTANRAPVEASDDWLVFCVWLGVLGWALQGLVEFGLYLPALAWPALTLLGWLLGKPPVSQNS